MILLTAAETRSLQELWRLIDLSYRFKLLFDEHYLGDSCTHPRDWDFICELVIRTVSKTIVSLSRKPDWDSFSHFVRINHRIYGVDLIPVLQLFHLTIIDSVKASVDQQLVLVKFLNYLVQLADSISDDTQLTDDYRLSYSDSNFSRLSLTNDSDSVLTLDSHRGSEMFKTESIVETTDIDEADFDDDDDAFDYLNSFAVESKKKKRASIMRKPSKTQDCVLM